MAHYTKGWIFFEAMTGWLAGWQKESRVWFLEEAEKGIPLWNDCLSALNIRFHICLYHSGVRTLPTAFPLYQPTLCWSLPVGGARGRVVGRKEKGTGSFLFCSCLLADYVSSSSARVVLFGSSRSISLRSRWFRYGNFPTLGNPASAHTSSHRHLHQLAGASSSGV